MEILGKNIGLTPEDKKIVIDYLKPYVKDYAKKKAKDTAVFAGKKLGPKLALKYVRIADEKLKPSKKRITKFAVSKTKDVLEKPEKEKQAKYDAKHPTKEQKKVIKAEKKEAKHKAKLKKYRAKGKLTLKAKLVSTATAMVGSAITAPKF